MLEHSALSRRGELPFKAFVKARPTMQTGEESDRNNDSHGCISHNQFIVTMSWPQVQLSESSAFSMSIGLSQVAAGMLQVR